MPVLPATPSRLAISNWTVRPGLARISSALTGAGFWRKAASVAVPTTAFLRLPKMDLRFSERAGSSANSRVGVLDCVIRELELFEKELTPINGDRRSVKYRMTVFMVLLL